MNLLPKIHDEFSQKEYWDSFFKKRGNKAFEWYGEYPELCEYLHKYVKKQDNILIAGCGNSNLGCDLYDVGFATITNVDISQVVIRQMLSKNEKERPGLKYLHMDVFKTHFSDAEFSVVLDKGTLDALMPDGQNESLKKINEYFQEIQRILKNGGRFVCISLLQEHILKGILDYFPSKNWMFRAVRCFEAENKALENGESTMPVFMVICTKFSSLPRFILELNLGADDKMYRFETIEEVIAQIRGVQQATFICAGLKHNSIANENEVYLDLFKPGELKPRFTVYIVDVAANSQNAPYAAFIVPQGREAEWLFSTTAGRKHLVKTTKHNRLTIITMHRGQKYGTLEDVQNELSETIRNLAPQAIKIKKIPFLSLGTDVGNRIIKYEGHSEYSGDYVVEDVETSDGKFRRLFYLNSQLVIQSEAKLKTIKSRKGVVNEVVDLTHLTCKHHIYMSIAAYLSCNTRDSNVAVIGLGGGGLCSFLHKFLPKATIVGVDIDGDMLKVATDWFGLQLGERLRVEIKDGLSYLDELTRNVSKLDAVLFDVDSKDTSIGMSCPPKQFLENSVLENLANIIDNKGVFILNMVIRDGNLKPTIVNSLRKKFKTIISFKLDDDLNEILICSVMKLKKTAIEKDLTGAIEAINNFFKKNHCSDHVNINDYLMRLKINL